MLPTLPDVRCEPGQKLGFSEETCLVVGRRYRDPRRYTLLRCPACPTPVHAATTRRGAPPPPYSLPATLATKSATSCASLPCTTSAGIVPSPKQVSGELLVG